MGELVPPGPPPQLPAIRNFSDLEPVIQALARVRESVATSGEPSEELLADVAAASALAARHEGDISAASAPASLGMVGVYLSALMEARPNPGQGDATFFGRILREDVFTLRPTEGAIEMACRRWRQKSKFLPTIAEMMVEVKGARDELAGAAEFASRLPALHAALAAVLSGKTE